MKVLIADDHPMVRDALERTVLRAVAEPEIHLAASYAEVETALARHDIDLALIDLNMPGMSGIAGLRRLRERHPTLLMAAVSGQDDGATVRAVLDLGLAGFLPKSDAPELLVQALRLMLSGGVYCPRHAIDQAPAPDPSGLTRRQRDVLRLLMQGDPNKVIARRLALTEGTVKIHVAAILRALQARNRTEAVVMARQGGIAWAEPGATLARVVDALS